MFKLVVLSVAVALVAAEPSVIAPLWGGHLAAPLVAGPLAAGLVAPVGAAIAAPVAAAPLAPVPIGVGNYRGPLSLAPGQPANVLAVDGRPLDTLDVNVDRAVHYTAKALNGVHLLKKRSLVAPWGAPIGLPLAARVVAPAPIAVAAAAPVATLGWGHGVHLGHLW
ncbi:unnamed protein product, partial [Brenthis ino]